MKSFTQSIALASFTVVALVATTAATAARNLSTVTYAPGTQLNGLVIHVADGDTLDILLADKSTVRVRFADIDAPEVRHGVRKPGQPFAQLAEKFVSKLTAGKTVNVDVVDTDHRSGRTVGTIFVDGLNVNQAVVDVGLAWAYRSYDPRKGCFSYRTHDRKVIDLERTAMSNHYVLFQDAEPEYPGIYRARVEGDGLSAKASAKVCAQ